MSEPHPSLPTNRASVVQLAPGSRGTGHVPVRAPGTPEGTVVPSISAQRLRGGVRLHESLLVDATATPQATTRRDPCRTSCRRTVHRSTGQKERQETMRAVFHRCLDGVALVTAVGCALLAQAPPVSAQSGKAPPPFVEGFPPPETVTRAYTDTDVHRAVPAYRVFSPHVVVDGLRVGFEPLGAPYHHPTVVLEEGPRPLWFTLPAGTPYAVLPLDLTGGPVASELPEGRLRGGLFGIRVIFPPRGARPPP